MKLFEKMFDMNHDGELDVFERAGEFAFVASFIDAQKEKELVDAGIDPEELEFMDSYE